MSSLKLAPRSLCAAWYKETTKTRQPTSRRCFQSTQAQASDAQSELFSESCCLPSPENDRSSKPSSDPRPQPLLRRVAVQKPEPIAPRILVQARAALYRQEKEGIHFLPTPSATATHQGHTLLLRRVPANKSEPAAPCHHVKVRAAAKRQKRDCSSNLLRKVASPAPRNRPKRKNSLRHMSSLLIRARKAIASPFRLQKVATGQRSLCRKFAARTPWTRKRCLPSQRAFARNPKKNDVLYRIQRVLVPVPDQEKATFRLRRIASLRSEKRLSPKVAAPRPDKKEPFFFLRIVAPRRKHLLRRVAARKLDKQERVMDPNNLKLRKYPAQLEPPNVCNLDNRKSAANFFRTHYARDGNLFRRIEFEHQPKAPRQFETGSPFVLWNPWGIEAYSDKDCVTQRRTITEPQPRQPQEKPVRLVAPLPFRRVLVGRPQGPDEDVPRERQEDDGLIMTSSMSSRQDALPASPLWASDRHLQPQQLGLRGLSNDSPATSRPKKHSRSRKSTYNKQRAEWAAQAQEVTWWWRDAEAQKKQQRNLREALRKAREGHLGLKGIGGGSAGGSQQPFIDDDPGNA